MTIDSYKLALEKAHADLAYAVQQRDEWTVEIARLQHLVNSLGAAVESKAAPDVVGIQELVLSLVGSSKTALTAMEIRDQLKAMGYDLSRYDNPLAVIHGSLHRLKDSEKIVERIKGRFQRAPLLSITEFFPNLVRVDKKKGKK